ncbi:DUF5329 family protein [Pontibacter fetidus]|uniref:DUF5329 domain-containing protein n=1 Tax=Pontibacter fetidus TaxID=2700082 RepID=A0A6B2H3L1_9BACT|nr:DUF5329 family protein [Pontibacter fetidus]NDK57705.1 DUF5329 domain-containing protein [Pontibacter fetidus]
MKTLLAIALFIFCLVAVQPAFAQQANSPATTVSATTSKPLSETEKINLLIESISTMKGATFIRNGSEHTCQEAAAHLKAKYEKHGSKIKSADEFISYLATKSSASGEVYKIRFADGHEEPTAEVLHHLLEQLK